MKLKDIMNVLIGKVVIRYIAEDEILYEGFYPSVMLSEDVMNTDVFFIYSYDDHFEITLRREGE